MNSFQNNTISNDMRSNTIGSSFPKYYIKYININTIGNNFQNNKIGNNLNKI